MMFRSIVAVVITGFFMACDSPQDEKIDCSVMKNPDASIELVSPRGGEVLKYGSKVNIKWKVDPNEVPSVVLQVSTTGENGLYKSIMNGSMATPLVSEVTCMDTVWTIGEEYAKVNWSATGGTSIYLRVAKYNDENAYKSVSSMITVNR